MKSFLEERKRQHLRQRGCGWRHPIAAGVDVAARGTRVVGGEPSPRDVDAEVIDDVAGARQQTRLTSIALSARCQTDRISSDRAGFKRSETPEARSKDTGTLEYDVFLSDDQSQGVVHERYRDSESLLQHIANLGELMAAIMKVASFTGEICGTPSPALVKALEGSGVRLFKLHQSL